MSDALAFLNAHRRDAAASSMRFARKQREDQDRYETSGGKTETREHNESEGLK